MSNEEIITLFKRLVTIYSPRKVYRVNGNIVHKTPHLELDINGKYLDYDNLDDVMKNQNYILASSIDEFKKVYSSLITDKNGLIYFDISKNNNYIDDIIELYDYICTDDNSVENYVNETYQNKVRLIETNNTESNEKRFNSISDNNKPQNEIKKLENAIKLLKLIRNCFSHNGNDIDSNYEYDKETNKYKLSLYYNNEKKMLKFHFYI